MNGPSSGQQESEPDVVLCDAGWPAGILASVDLLLSEASARLGQLPGPTFAAAQHIMASAQAIVRCELNSDAQQFCPIALSEARAAVVAATYAARHIHDAAIRGRGSTLDQRNN
jgi:hypothetical protein